MTDSATAEYRAGVGRTLLLLLICVVFTAIGVGLIAIGGSIRVVAGSLAVLFFGVVGFPALAYRGLVKRSVMVRLDETGVKFHQRPLVPWHEIEDVQARTVMMARMVVLLLKPGATERIATGEGGSAIHHDKKLLGRDAVTTAPSTPGGPDKLAAEIRERLHSRA